VIVNASEQDIGEKRPVGVKEKIEKRPGTEDGNAKEKG